jgi:hypothetical protein
MRNAFPFACEGVHLGVGFLSESHTAYSQQQQAHPYRGRKTLHNLPPLKFSGFHHQETSNHEVCFGDST